MPRPRLQRAATARQEKVQLPIAEQNLHMHRNDEQGRGDFEDAFCPVPHASGFRMVLAPVTQNNMHSDHVEDPNYVYQMRRPLSGMPSAT